MTPTKAHINRVLNVNGYAFVDPKEAPNLTQRYTESYMRRRLFAVEDETIITIYGYYRQAFRDIEQRANDMASQLGMRSIENNSIGIEWRRRLNDYTQVRLRELALQIAEYAYDRTVLSYLASYYGKLWMLDSMTVNDVVNMPRLTSDDASKAVMSKQLLEDVSNKMIYELMGQEWREQYRNELDLSILKIRNVYTRGMRDGQTIKQLMNGVADVLGVSIDRRRTGIPDVRANFNRVQTLTRSYVINANNSAALSVYHENASVVGGIQWLTARDGRVCPICQALEGQTWAIEDSIGLRHPVSDTHPQCRCSLIPVLREETPQGQPIEIVPDEQMPNTTFTDWLVGFGLNYILSDFLKNERQIDSTRIYDDELDNPTY